MNFIYRHKLVGNLKTIFKIISKLNIPFNKLTSININQYLNLINRLSSTLFSNLEFAINYKEILNNDKLLKKYHDDLFYYNT